MKDLASIPLPNLQSAPGPGMEPEMEWVRADDGVQLMCRKWRGKVGAPVILYLHGIEGHSQWFENTAAVLNEKGMTVYAPDRRGSGLNSRDRGHLSSYKVLLSDINQMLRRISQQHAGHPIIVWGNCWGAKAAAIVCQEVNVSKKTSEKEDIWKLESFPISALVLTSPALFTKIDPDLKTKIEIAYNHLCGGRRALRKWALPLRPSMFTNNALYLDFLEKDPLRLTEVTSTFLVESYKLSKLAEKAAVNIKRPVLILQPEADQIVDIARLKAWNERLRSPDKSMRVFPDAFHCLDFDANWFKEYTHLVSEWLLSRQPVVS